MSNIVLPEKGDQDWDETLNADLTTLNNDKVDKTQEAADIAAAVAAHVSLTDPHGDRADAASKYLLHTDPSVTNSRTPTAHAGTHATNGSDPISPASIGADAAGAAAAAVSAHVALPDAHGDRADAAAKYLPKNDATVTNARTPTAHASSHASGGSDPISAASIGADAAGAATAAVSAHVGTADAHGDRADAAAKYLLKSDASVTNSRTPLPHAASHTSGGSDPISLAGIGALAAASVGGATDLQPHGNAAAGSTSRYADAGHVHPSPFWVPGDNNLLAATYDPAHAGTVTSQTNANVAGKITLTKVVIRQSITWSNVWFGLAGVDGAATLSNCYVGVYDSAGNLKAVTADLSSVLTVNPVAKAVSFTTPFTAAPGTYFIALLLNGAWTTNSFTFKSSGAGVSVNAGLTAPNLRYSNLLTGQTALPATLSLASQTSTIITGGWGSQWYGIS
ncbi:hypothetical protein [Streptomyces sp. NPDC006631]|uniref:hypothetical protein n=1 Tax=Streptomyces sp. NPDC006631 TaxID=3364752 RepID=UPI0036A031F7